MPPGPRLLLIENFKVGDLARHGLDFASLHTRLPRLVYCSVTGFGQSFATDRPLMLAVGLGLERVSISPGAG